eukprot:3395834-Rhodomonas_salina.1
MPLSLESTRWEHRLSLRNTWRPTAPISASESHIANAKEMKERIVPASPSPTCATARKTRPTSGPDIV